MPFRTPFGLEELADRQGGADGLESWHAGKPGPDVSGGDLVAP